MRPAESSSEQQIFLAGMEIANVSESNVQAMATPIAGASVDRGVEVEVR